MLPTQETVLKIDGLLSTTRLCLFKCEQQKAAWTPVFSGSFTSVSFKLDTNETYFEVRGSVWTKGARPDARTECGIVLRERMLIVFSAHA